MRRSRRIILFVAAAAALFVPLVTGAQNTQPDSARERSAVTQNKTAPQKNTTTQTEPAPTRRVIQQNRLLTPTIPKRDLAASLRVIRPMLRTDPERAIELLRKLSEDYPRNAQVLDLLGQSYMAVGLTDSAIAVYERSLRVQPNNVRSGAALGTILVQSNRPDEAERVFKTLLRNTQNAVNTYRTIGSELSRAGFYDLALKKYIEGRTVNNNNYVLTLDIGHLQKTIGNFEGALDEYLLMIETSPRHYPLARDRILELLSDPRAEPDSLLSRLSAAADADSLYRKPIMNVLSLGYLEQGMIENALDVALEAEKIGVSDGKILFNLCERTVDEYNRRSFEEREKFFDLGLRALEAFIDGHPKSPQLPRAKLMLVDLLVDLAQGRVDARPGLALDKAADKAIEGLDWIITTFPGTDHMEEAYLKKGDVVFRVMKQPQQALEIYKLGLSTARYYPTAFAERLGRLYLVIGDYDKAEEYFSRLIDQPAQELREAGVYYAGLLLSVKGQYETARDTLVSLAEGNPASQFTNDAIELSWVIEEGLQGKREVLDHYIGGLRLEVAEDTTAAIEQYAAILALPADTPLRARALFRTGELYQGSGPPDRALEAFETFVRDYPTDTRVPDAYRRVGQVYEKDLGNIAMALEKYEDILLTYPHYIFLDDVRADVMRLREKTGAQP